MTQGTSSSSYVVNETNKWGWISLYVVTITFAILGNLLFLLACSCTKRSRHTCYYLLINLSLRDILLGRLATYFENGPIALIELLHYSSWVVHPLRTGFGNYLIELGVWWHLLQVLSLLLLLLLILLATYIALHGIPPLCGKLQVELCWRGRVCTEALVAYHLHPTYLGSYFVAFGQDLGVAN